MRRLERASSQNGRLRTTCCVARFFSVGDPAPADAACIHNAGFAFCSHTDASTPTERAYVFVALTGPRPTPIKLARFKAGA